jgi:hypothetical protein
LSKFAVSRYQGTDQDVELIVDVDEGSNTSDIVYLAMPAGSGWVTSDLTAGQVTVFGPATGNTLQTMSYSSYEAAHATNNILSYAIASCVGPRYIDNLQVTLSGSTTTEDFEYGGSAITGGLTLATNKSSVLAGQPVTVSGTLTAGGAGYAGAPVDLWAKTYPATTFSKIATVTADASGAVSSTQEPRAQTTYQWQFPGDSNVNAVNSSTKVVTVKAGITTDFYKTSFSHSTPLVMWGSTTPSRSGSTVLLKRHTASGDKTVASAKVAKDGTYGIVKTLSRGTYSLKAVIGSGDGTLGNSTGLTKVIVS